MPALVAELPHVVGAIRGVVMTGSGVAIGQRSTVPRVVLAGQHELVAECLGDDDRPLAIGLTASTVYPAATRALTHRPWSVSIPTATCFPLPTRAGAGWAVALRSTACSPLGAM